MSEEFHTVVESKFEKGMMIEKGWLQLWRKAY